MRIQRILTDTGIPFDQEVEGNDPSQLQMQMDYVAPTFKIKVKPENVELAMEAIRNKLPVLFIAPAVYFKIFNLSSFFILIKLQLGIVRWLRSQKTHYHND